MLYGNVIDKIRNLPEDSIYLIRLKIIEYKVNNGHISAEQALEEASDLVLDFCKNNNVCNNTSMNIPIYNCEDSLEIAIKTNDEIRIGNILSSKNYVTAPPKCHPKVNVSCQGQIPYFVHEKTS